MRRLYDSVRWRKVAKSFLSQHPLCAMCARMGRVTAASIVDHIAPHAGNMMLFWDTTNMQSLCASCHSGTKRIQEGRGFSQACGVDGMPLDAGHPWGDGGPNLQGPSRS